jgi:hypothetical protein
MLTKLTASIAEYRSKSYNKHRQSTLPYCGKVPAFGKNSKKNQNFIHEEIKSISNSENAYYYSIHIPVCSPKI